MTRDRERESWLKKKKKEKEKKKESMVLTEYDTTRSSAIDRLAYNHKKREMIVKFRDNPSVYLYSNVHPRELASLESPTTSLGKFVNKIKQLSEFRRINDFPRNVRMFEYPESSREKENVTREGRNRGNSNHHTIASEKVVFKSNGNDKGTLVGKSVPNPKKKNRFKDYTSLWLNVLATHTVGDRDYLQSLIPALQKCHPKYPPSRRPPPLPTDEVSIRDGIRNMNINSPNPANMHNMFNMLSIDESTSKGYVYDSKGRNSGNVKRNVTANIDVEGIQTRYLLVRVYCSIAENFRNEGVSSQKSKDYENCKSMWSLALNTLKLCEEDIAEWYAMLYLRSNELDMDPFDITGSPSGLPDKHDRDQLVDLFKALHLLIEDTERQKEKTLAQLSRRMQYVAEKLNPMLRARDDVKSVLGDDKWKNNPEPKFDFAIRRKEWEEEMKALSSAVNFLRSLNFYAICQQ